jgi:hypothetical protein
MSMLLPEKYGPEDCLGSCVQQEKNLSRMERFRKSKSKDY